MFIIWTLRRTGGTNFTQWITKLSNLKATEHEPFNRDRLYGYVTKNFLESKNTNTAKEEIKKILKTPQVIKHCVETVPKGISESLAEVSTELGYKHLFLYRKNSKYRLLSLHFAKQTGIWGPNLKNKSKEKITENIIKEPIPINNLINREKKDREILKYTFEYIQNLNNKKNVKCITFEGLYEIELQDTVKKIKEILEFLSISLEKKEIENHIKEMRKKGNQKTRHLYDKFPNIRNFEEELLKLGNFEVCKRI